MSEEKYTAFCFKCKTKRDIKNPELGKMKTGMNTVRGICSECEGKVYRILPKDK